MCPPLLKKLRRIIAAPLCRLRGWVLPVWLCAVLAACSTAQLAYHQAPRLLHWWIDGQVDLSDTQTDRVRQDIDALFAWHRQQELPLYVSRLAQWQGLASRNLTATQVCGEFDALRAAGERIAERGAEALARLALKLTPAQIAHLQREQQKSNERFAEDFLEGSEEDRLDTRLDQAVDRYEILYGRLNETQRAQVLAGLRQSPFDARRSQAERLRRQTDLLQTIRQIQALPRTDGGNGSAPAAAVEAVRGWFQRNLQSPDPAYASLGQQMLQHGCEQFAALHNSTTPTQRAHALQLIQDYGADFSALAAQR
jgi:hypothetical protein